MKDIGTIKRRLGGIGSVLGGFRPGTASRLLVFESTGFALYGMVARRDITAETAQVAVSWAPEPEAAVGEVLARLREMEGKRLPGKAVLVTPSAVGRLVNLPVDPRNPQPPAQMRELVRWEVEELFVRHNDLWSLGALLVGRGYLAPAERLELESASGERRTDPDLYVELVGGRARIDECLAMQEQLLYADDELVPGWSPQAKEDEGGPWTWYGAGIGDSVRTRWVRAFQRNKVFCATIHPELGAAIPLIPLIPSIPLIDTPAAPDTHGMPGTPAAGKDGWLFLDIRQEQFGVFRGVGSRLDASAVEMCHNGIADPEDMATVAKRLLHSGVRNIYYAAAAELDEPLRAALCEVTANANVGVVPVVSGGQTLPDAADRRCPPPVLASMLGTARRALQPGKAILSAASPGIEARPPAPPVWKNRELWPWAAIVLLLLAAVGHGIYMNERAAAKEKELDHLEIEYTRNLKIIDEARSSNAETSLLAAELKARQAELQGLEHLRDVLDNVILRRQRTIPGVLAAIARAADDGIVLDLIEEKDDWSGFRLEGWARRDTDGPRFGKKLNEALAPWGYSLDDMSLNRGRGRLGIDGFTFKAQLGKVAPKTTAPAAEAAAESDNAEARRVAPEGGNHD